MTKHLARAEINDKAESFAEHGGCDHEALSQNIWAQMQNEYQSRKPGGEYAFKTSRDEQPSDGDSRGRSNTKAEFACAPQNSMKDILPAMQFA